MPESTPSLHTVFVSHAHADNEVCDRYVAALRARGLNVWYDRTNLQAGHSLSSDIEAELRQRSAFVVIATPASLASQWVKSEIAAFRSLAAQDSTRLFLPVRAAVCEMPLLWADILWIDAVSLGFEAAVEALAVALGTPAARPLPPRPEPVPAAPRATSPPAESVDDLLTQARLLQPPSLQRAIQLYERATQLDPRRADAWSRLGGAYLVSRRYTDALAAFDRALALDDTQIDYWKSKGETFDFMERYEEALAMYERALKIAPNDEGLWFSKAQTLGLLGRNREAEQAQKRWHKLAFGGRLKLW
jgi:tetratricopeptide (TPR) repeat protein